MRAPGIRDDAGLASCPARWMASGYPISGYSSRAHRACDRREPGVLGLAVTA
jgi:hypothetical protein